MIAPVLTTNRLRLTRPEHAAMILALGPVNIVFWQWFRTRHRPHAATLACIATALCGEALVVSQGDLARLVSGGGALGNLAPVSDLTAEEIRAFRKVRDIVAFDPDTVCGINECFKCVNICRVNPVCVAVCRVCRVCDFECTCGPCNIGGRGGRFGGLGE